MRERVHSRRNAHAALTLVFFALLSAGCAAREDPSESTRAAIRGADAGVGDVSAGHAPPDDAARASTNEILREALVAHPGPAATALKTADEATLRRFGAAARAASESSRAREGLPVGAEVLHDEHAVTARRTVAPDGEQASALVRLGAVAAGVLVARWDDSFGGPAALERLWFVRRSVPDRAVVGAFLDEHFADIHALWKIGARSELVVSGSRPLDAATTVVDVERRVDGVPVQGEWFEAHVTGRDSRFGAGVLTHFGGSVQARPALPSATPRAHWLSASDARRAAGVVGVRGGERLVYTRGVELQPVWIVRDGAGLERSIDAITGALLGTHDTRGFLGPTTIQGWPPGATSVQAITFRGANVTDAAGVSQGQLALADGDHTFTNSNLRVQLAGPVGVSNPAAIGRVYRTDNRMGLEGNPLPFAQVWDAAMFPQATFGTPDLWAPNSGTVPFPHTTEIVYGWLSYWQHLVGVKVGLQVVDRLEFRVDPWLDGSNNAVPFGFWGAVAAIADRTQPDDNGAMTAALITFGSGLSDDVRAAEFAPGGTGDEIWTAAHEYGHTITACASAPGSSCVDVAPAFLLFPTRSTYLASDWRPAVWDGHAETNASFVGNVLTQFRYRNGRNGAAFMPAWTYVSYDDPNDSFGSPTQSNSGISNCLATGSPPCPSGSLCIPARMHQLSYPDPDSRIAGWCEPIYATWTDPMGTPTVLTDDVQGTPTPCPAGLFPTPRGFYGTSPMVQVCWQDQYQNKFFDTVGSRLVSMVGWRQGLRTTFHAVSGQSANPKRDLILGADSYRERYTAGSTHRYEAMRAVRSVYQGTGFVVNDDFPDVLPNAPILPIRGQGWVPIWWGNGQSDYPNSEDMADIDTVLVRGAAGHRFEIEASGLIASTAPAIDLWRVDGATPKFIQSSLTGSLQTSALAVTAWYMVAFVPQSVGSWQARMRHLTGSDDFSGDVSEAWPLVHDVALDAQATSGDTDAFAFDIPSSALGSSLTLTINAPFASAITVGERLGTSWSSVGTWSVSAGVATVTIPVGSNVSRFAFALSASGDGAYTVRANLACASATAPCDVSQAPSRAAVNAWGDRFAGRLDGATNIHEFTIDLAEGDNVSVSVTDNDLACRPRIELFPADVQRHFLDAADVMQPVFVWDDGAPVNHVSADTVGAGGHFEAASAGTYRIRVRPGAAACPWYRMHIAKVYPSLDARPAW